MLEWMSECLPSCKASTQAYPAGRAGLGLFLFLLGWAKVRPLQELEDYSLQYPWPLTPDPLGQALGYS